MHIKILSIDMSAPYKGRKNKEIKKAKMKVLPLNNKMKK